MLVSEKLYFTLNNKQNRLDYHQDNRERGPTINKGNEEEINEIYVIDTVTIDVLESTISAMLIT